MPSVEIFFAAGFDLVASCFLLRRVLLQECGHLGCSASLGIGDEDLVDGDLVVLGVRAPESRIASTMLASVFLMAASPSLTRPFVVGRIRL